MGTYSTWDFYNTFGGWPEPGETYPDDLDAAVDKAERYADEHGWPKYGELTNPADIATGDNW